MIGWFFLGCFCGSVGMMIALTLCTIAKESDDGEI